ncbi:MAG: TrbC/VirB2 family protein [Spirochaetales bacterium]
MLSLIFVFVICGAKVFAADGIPELEEGANSLLELFSSGIFRAIMTVALLIIFGVIAFGNAQGEGGMFKKTFPWIVGVLGVGSASAITDYFLT